jgi:hypothetical protein
MKKYCAGYRNGEKYNPDFCFGVSNPPGGRYPNLVGCQQMDLHIYFLGGIYYYGKWINLRGDFMYDKRTMENLVKQAGKEFSDCPYIDVKRAQSFIFWWPNIVNPNKDERISIWPPVIDKFESGLLEIGLNMSGSSATPFGEEYPVFSDTNYFLELINRVYGENIQEDIKAGLLASYNEICQQKLYYFD